MISCRTDLVSCARSKVHVTNDNTHDNRKRNHHYRKKKIATKKWNFHRRFWGMLKTHIIDLIIKKHTLAKSVRKTVCPIKIEIERVIFSHASVGR